MKDMQEYNDAIVLFRNSIALFSELKPYVIKLKKSTVKPKYKQTARGLYRIIDNILVANQNMMTWHKEFERMSLNEASFLNFSESFTNFRTGPFYYLLSTRCQEIGFTYQNHELLTYRSLSTY